MKYLIFSFLIVPCMAMASDLPDPNITPGYTNPAVTQETIKQTICVKGWTKTIRPPATYTNELKKQQLAEYGFSDKNPRHYEEDHLISLELGGDPRDRRNLWPQHRLGRCNASQKDKLENKLNIAVCKGNLPLYEAQQEISTNWITAYQLRINQKGCK